MYIQYIIEYFIFNFIKQTSKILNNSEIITETDIITMLYIQNKQFLLNLNSKIVS